MYLSGTQTFIIILAVAAGTMVTRFTPFILFPEDKQHPPVIDFLARFLPPAMMGLLVVYCLKDVSLLSGSHGLPELLSVTVVALLHLGRRNVLLSIVVGTVIYMVLIQIIFI